MTSEKLAQAVQLIKSGNKIGAIPILKEIVQADPSNENAWLWLYSCVEKSDQKIYCLKQALKINPDNQKTHDALFKLENKTSPNIQFEQVKNSGNFCPHCQSVQIFQRSKTVNNTGNALGCGCGSGLITFVILMAYGVNLRLNDLSGYYYGSSWLYSSGSDMNLFIATIVVALLAGVIYFLTSRKTIIYYECLNCKTTW